MNEKILIGLFGAEVVIGAVVATVGFSSQNWLLVGLGASVSIFHVLEGILLISSKKQ